MSLMCDVKTRLELGKSKYGHGVRVNMDTTTWGTPKNSWMEMAKEEFLDAVVYVSADYIVEGRKNTSVSNMEAYYINDLESPLVSDDNNLILYIIENKHDMEACKHKTLLFNLVNILDVY
jgi:hypothetical protein